MKNMKIKLKYYKKRLNNMINYKTIKNHIKKINKHQRNNRIRFYFGNPSIVS